MSEENNLPPQIAQLSVGEEDKQSRASLQELLDSLESVQDDIGQICELTSEEENLVTAFFESLLKFMQPLSAMMEVSPAVLPEKMENIVKANIDPAGHLMILYKDGKIELRNLKERTNRDLLISVISDVMPKFKQLTELHRQKIGSRVKFLSAVTKELQKISKAFSTAMAQQSE